MIDSIFFVDIVKEVIAKVTSSIRDNGTWGTKSSKDMGLEELHHDTGVIRAACLGFHLFGHRIDRHEYVKETIRVIKSSHEINVPYIEYLDNMDGI